MVAYCENMTTTFHTVFYLVFVKRFENLSLSIDNQLFRISAYYCFCLGRGEGGSDFLKHKTDKNNTIGLKNIQE